MFKVADLPYDYTALEPYLNADIMHYHHDAHHAVYVKNLNAVLEKYAEGKNKTIEELLKSLDSMPPEIRTAVKNNGGGHYHHSLFWQMLSPKTDQKPNGVLLKKIQHTFGDFETFQNQFSDNALKIFGSGWQWLVLDKDELTLMSTPNQDSPITQGLIPLLTLDVWEHAYYLQYYNKRADYIQAFWHVVNWKEVSSRLPIPT